MGSASRGPLSHQQLVRLLTNFFAAEASTASTADDLRHSAQPMKETSQYL